MPEAKKPEAKKPIAKQPEPKNPEPRKTSRLLIALAILVTCTVLDQWTKNVASAHFDPDGDGIHSREVYRYLGDTLRIQYAENTGAFLGWGTNFSDRTRFLLLTLTTGVFILALGIYGLFQWKMEGPKFIGIQLIFAGGLGNLYDRIVYDGSVIDFMNMGIGSLRTGIFNVADVAITGGAVLLLLLGFKKPAPEAGGETATA